jgi:dUTP pyrophosphatase
MGSVLSATQIREYLKSSPPLLEDFVDLDAQIQPQGVDLSLRSVQEYQTRGQLGLTNKERSISQTSDLKFYDGWLDLTPGCYLVTFNEVVHLPVNVMALGRPRSSLLRMGATVETAVWDAGYNGRSQSLLVIYNPKGIRLAKNVI